MNAAALALKAAIHARLATDAALLALIPATRLLDRAPQGTPMPFLLHGPVRSEDLSTGAERLAEHLLTLEVWADAAGQKQALTVAERIEALLDDQPLALTGVTLVSLTLRSTRLRREARARAVVAEMVFRAVTEG